MNAHQNMITAGLLLAPAILIGTTAPAGAAEFDKMSFPVATDMSRAEIFFVHTASRPSAVLVLCPGFNGTGDEYLTESAWQTFAGEHHLGLMVLSFASDPTKISKTRGYYIPSSGSGQIVLDAIGKKFGSDLPIIIYGFSSGAFFSHQFADWRPERVLAWAADAGSNGRQTHHPKDPPGLVACGAQDDGKFAGALDYFQVGRSVAKPWLWVSIPDKTHERSAPFEEFVRDYFAAVLSPTKGCWVNKDTKIKISEEAAAKNPLVSGWLPGENLFEKWKEIHE